MAFAKLEHHRSKCELRQKHSIAQRRQNVLTKKYILYKNEIQYMNIHINDRYKSK